MTDHISERGSMFSKHQRDAGDGEVPALSTTRAARHPTTQLAWSVTAREWWRALPAALAVVALCCGPSMGQATLSPQQVWAHLRDVDARVHTCSLVWNEAVTIERDPSIDPDFFASKAREQLEHDKVSASSAATIIADVRREMQEQKATGIHQTSLVHFETRTSPFGAWCSVQSDDKLPPSIDMYLPNGGYNVSVNGSMPNPHGAPTRVADVDRDPAHFMSGTAGGFGQMVWYAGTPLSEVFARGTFFVEASSPGTVVLVRTVPGTMPDLARLTVSLQDWRPRKLEFINPLGNVIFSRIVFSSYASYPVPAANSGGAIG